MKLLFLCTANSCRSILSEALFNHLAPAGLRAYSAGSQPRGEVHPLSLATLRRAGIACDGLSSKGSETHAELAPDIVITVCDNAAGETCPVWPGRPIAAHWGIEDPAAVEGEGQRRAFERALGYLRNRISLLLALPDDGIDALALKAIGRAEGATPSARQDA